jgi:hypothetical protein
MGMLVTFTEASGDEVHQKLEWEGIPRAPHLSSRLLNRQIKYAMHKLQREITREVLDGLEKLMRSRTRDAWGPTFCTILLLCFCIEGIQTAAETFIVCDIEKSQIDFQTAKFNQEHCFTACKNLDTYPYQQTTTLFNEIFRTQRRREAFNPLRSLRESAITGLEGPADLMAQSIFSTFDSCKHPNSTNCNELPLKTQVRKFTNYATILRWSLLESKYNLQKSRPTTLVAWHRSS